MNTIEKRDYIHNYLYRLLDKDIDEVFIRVKSIVEKDVVLTEEQEEELDKRITRHKNGESKSFSWPEVKERVHSKS
jgi:putative addiction module component (TIGR02574 family)